LKFWSSPLIIPYFFLNYLPDKKGTNISMKELKLTFERMEQEED